MISSQKGTFGLNNNVIFGSSLKLAQLIALCPNPGISTEEDTVFWPKECPDALYIYYFLLYIFMMQKTIQETCGYTIECDKTKFRSSKDIPKGAQSKFRSSKVVPEGMQSQNVT